jgi:hypothetical protein
MSIWWAQHSVVRSSTPFLNEDMLSMTARVHRTGLNSMSSRWLKASVRTVCLTSTTVPDDCQVILTSRGVLENLVSQFFPYLISTIVPDDLQLRLHGNSQEYR